MTLGAASIVVLAYRHQMMGLIPAVILGYARCSSGTAMRSR